MSAREAILASIRRNRPALVATLPDIPDFGGGVDLIETFRARLQQMGGKLLAAGTPDDPWHAARALVAQAAEVCSMVPALPGNRSLQDAAPAALHTVDLAILQARFAVAETGSVALLASDLGITAIGYLAQRLLILLDPADIVENLHHAYARPEFAEGNYLVLQTGPSATADIEGVMIRGAQGVRSLTVMIVPRGA